MKRWPVVTLSFPEKVEIHEWEILSWELLANGCLGLEEKGVEEDGVPASAVLYFPAAEPDGSNGNGNGHDWPGVVKGLAQQWLPGRSVTIDYELLEDRDWGEGWRPYYHQTRCTERIYVGPPEESKLPEDAPANAIYVAIEYGRAFGTGTHPSTQGCLVMMERLVPTICGSVLDIGTGSGVLCIAAVKLGAEYAVGMDNADACEDNFLRNAELNNCEEEVNFFVGDSVDAAVGGCLLCGRAIPELLVCNMLSTEFDSLLQPMRRLRKPLILSGFLEADAAVMQARLEETGWSVIDRITIEEWDTWYCEGK